MSKLNVKIGDEVLLHFSKYSKNYYKIAVITKITPTGRIKVDNSNTFYNENGVEMGNKDVWAGHSWLEELTEEKKQKLIHMRKAKEMKKHISDELNNLSYETLKKIEQIILENAKSEE